MATLHADLLKQAELLAKADKKKPKQANIRRAISTAYYSLFHFLIDSASKQIAGAGQDKDALKMLVSRGFEHGKMKAVCSEFCKATPKTLLQPFWSNLQVATVADAQLVGNTFVELQELRHQADYDLAVAFSRQEAMNAIQRVSNAKAAWERMRTHNGPVCELFALTLLIWPLIERRS